MPPRDPSGIIVEILKNVALQAPVFCIPFLAYTYTSNQPPYLLFRGGLNAIISQCFFETIEYQDPPCTPLIGAIWSLIIGT